jgi:hypothetical protein
VKNEEMHCEGREVVSVRRKAFWLMVCVLFLSFMVCQAFGEEPTPEKRRAIEELMEVINLRALGDVLSKAVIWQMRVNLKNGGLKVSPKASSILEEEISSFMREETEKNGGLYEYVCLLYDKHFTLQDIKELIAFYETPIGRKVVRLSPMMSVTG